MSVSLSHDQPPQSLIIHPQLNRNDNNWGRVTWLEREIRHLSRRLFDDHIMIIKAITAHSGTGRRGESSRRQLVVGPGLAQLEPSFRCDSESRGGRIELKRPASSTPGFRIHQVQTPQVPPLLAISAQNSAQSHARRCQKRAPTGFSPFVSFLLPTSSLLSFPFLSSLSPPLPPSSHLQSRQVNHCCPGRCGQSL